MIARIHSRSIPFPWTALAALVVWATAGNAGLDLCLPTPDGSGCLQSDCPIPGEVCQPRCINFDPATGLSQVTDCECGLPTDCHLEFMGAPGPACLVPDNGTGTATLPPMGCSYIGDQPWLLRNGFPSGTTLELDGELGQFICLQTPPGCTVPVTNGQCEATGGTLGGDGECFDSLLEFRVTGTGLLAGYTRTLSVSVQCEVHTGPRTPGDPVQTMDAVFYRMHGELIGDPDFDRLRVSAGQGLGLPGPGITTLRQLPSGDFAVDSFFDIAYELEFTGAPGSVLEGFSGTTTNALRLYTGGSGAECVGACPAGGLCEQQVTVLADGTLEICCGCPPENPDLKWSQLPAPGLPGLPSYTYDLGGGLVQLLVADDWLCPGGLVTDIHWWGNYELDPTGQERRGAGIQLFLLTIHLPDAQDPCLPGPPLVNLPVPFAAAGETDSGLVNIEGSPIYRYSHILDLPFDQDEGQTYFLVIHALPVDPLAPAVWRWQEHQRGPVPILCGAAEQAPPAPWRTILWPGVPEEFSDMAFEITSQPLLPPVADANGPYSADEGSPVFFDGSGSSDLDGTIVQYEWDFDSDGVYESSLPTATVIRTWYDNTNATVTLRVTDNQGLTDTDTAPVIIANVDPILAAIAATSVDEGQNSTLTGSFSDPGTDDTFTLSVNWGDGAPVVHYPYPAGSTAISNLYTYLDDKPSGTPSDSYTISVTLQDDDLGSTSTVTLVTVSNIPPVLTNVTANSVQEGGICTVNGNIVDASPFDSFILRVDWDDGTTPTSNTYTSGSTLFSETHTYLDDDPSGTPQDSYTITITLEDDDTGITTNRPMVTVSNAPPKISGTSVTPTSEGGTSTLTGNFSDPGLLDTFTLTVDWDDGTVDAVPYPAGSTAFLETHTYGPSSNYVVGFNLKDDDLGASQGFLSVTVSNVPPTADANGPYTGRVGEDVQLDGTGSTDPGNDIVLYEWDLDYNGVYNNASGPTPLFQPWWVGPRTIGLKVTDDDGASDVDTATVTGEPPLPCPKWIQEVDCEFGLDVPSWYSAPEPAGSQPTVADDWLCDGRPLVGIQWWGSYIGYLSNLPDPFVPPPGGPDRPTDFRVSWYTDVPATPTSHSQPGDLLEERIIRLADFVFGPTDPIPGAIIEETACLVDLGWIAPGLVEHVYRYTYWVLPGEEFNEKAGTVYWLSVEAGYDSNLPPPAWRWGWTTTAPQWNWNDDAVFQVDPPIWDEMVYPPPGWEFVPGHPYEGQSVNQAFVLLTDVCPARCIKWGQPPDMVEGVNMLSSRIDGSPGPVRADDFVSDGRAITDLHWWGSYPGWRSDLTVYTFPPSGLERPIAFELRWHAEDPADPSLPQAAPLLGYVWVDIDRCHEVYYGTVDQSGWNPQAPFEHEFQYYVDLLDPRIRESVPWPELDGVHYWLSIQAVFATNWVPGKVHGGWGWKTAPVMQPFPAVFSPDGVAWLPDVYPPGHPRAGAPYDLSFELTTTNLPPHDIRLLSLDPAAFVTLVSSGYCGCGVQVLEHVGPSLTNGWSGIQTNLVPHQTNIWVVPQVSLTNRYFRIDAREP